MIVIDTKMIRDIEKSQLIMSKNDVSDCRFLIFESFRNSKFECIEFEITERIQFVLKANDFEKNKLFEFSRDNLKLKKKTCLYVVIFLSNRRII